MSSSKKTTTITKRKLGEQTQHTKPTETVATNGEPVPTKEPTEDVPVIEEDDFVHMKVETSPPPQPKPELRIPTKTAMEDVIKVERKAPALRHYYCVNHYWNETTPPHTIIVAHNEDEARTMLLNNLIIKYKVNSNQGKEELMNHPKSKKENLIIEHVLPIHNAGVCILSIGLGLISSKPVHTPYVVQYKSSVSDINQLKLFYSNNHYSSPATPPASLILAKDVGEATEFLMKALKELGVSPNENKNMTVLPIDSSTPSVYFICKTSFDTDEGDSGMLNYGSPIVPKQHRSNYVPIPAAPSGMDVDTDVMFPPNTANFNINQQQQQYDNFGFY